MPLLQRSVLIRLARAHQILGDARQPPPPIALLAHQLAMSRAHFMRRFRSVFGESALQFSMRERLRHARLLLASGEESVTDVCLRLGYSSPATFSLLFKRHAGESPSRYRRRSWPVGEVHRALQPGCMDLFAMAWTSMPRHFSISGKSSTMADWSNDTSDPEHA